jgi:polyphosphate glucokinase
MKSSVKAALAVDVGGSSVKILATGQSERRSFSSGPTLTPRRMVSEVKKLAGDWRKGLQYDGCPACCRRRVINEE